MESLLSKGLVQVLPVVFCNMDGDLMKLKHGRCHNGIKTSKSDIRNKACCKSSALRSRKTTITAKRLFKCGFCDKTFAKLNGLKQHEKIHTSKRTHKCDICSRKFIYANCLLLHKRVHTGEKPYKCDICDKTFAQTSFLLPHRRTHTGEKPFKCDSCDRRFISCSNLAKHRRTHTGEKPYECNICRRLFVQSSHLKSHKGTHRTKKPFKCGFCNKEYSVLASFKQHVKACNKNEIEGINHGDETIVQDLKCKECDTTFSSQKIFDQHQLNHELEATEATGMEYLCFKCDETFDILRNLIDHVRKAHRNQNQVAS